MSLGKLDKNILKNAMEKGKAQPKKEEIDYIRFRSPFRGVERGTVIAPGGKIIWGFPHIKRIFTLKAGMEKNIHESTVYFEQKIDGFNVRIAKIGTRIYAFSRGGFLDPFVTEKAREAGLESFFDAHPKYILCGEMIGNTPYTKPTKDFDVKLFVFDIDDGHNNYLPCEMKYEILRKCGVPSVPVIGKFKTSDSKGMDRAVQDVNKARKEGIVIKSEGRKDVVKYVNPNADIDDIANCSGLFFDMPFGFFNQRVLRSAYFIRDYGMDREKYGKELGIAFYEGIAKALDALAAGRNIEDEFEILIKDEKIWDEIRRHMGKEVKLSVIFKRKEKDRTRIRFSKTYLRTTRLLRAYLNGKGMTD
ncbi:RNA ligase [Candidatus Micrarchaeota archaeon]|nr:RNA ligase [Candidatus Micrarchaeota archaeon]